MSIGAEEIRNRFGTHKASIEGPDATLPRHAQLRRAFTAFADELDEVLPDGREKSVAFTELENASMWAHKSVAKAAPLDEDSFRIQGLGPGAGGPRDYGSTTP